MMPENEIQRALGRIEGTQDRLLSEFEQFRKAMTEHMDMDKVQFEILHSRITELRKYSESRFVDQTDDRARHLGEQDIKLDALKEKQDKAMGAGWVIMGILGMCVACIGAMALAIFERWLR